MYPIKEKEEKHQQQPLQFLQPMIGATVVCGGS